MSSTMNTYCFFLWPFAIELKFQTILQRQASLQYRVCNAQHRHASPTTVGITAQKSERARDKDVLNMEKEQREVQTSPIRSGVPGSCSKLIGLCVSTAIILRWMVAISLPLHVWLPGLLSLSITNFLSIHFVGDRHTEGLASLGCVEVPIDPCVEKAAVRRALKDNQQQGEVSGKKTKTDCGSQDIQVTICLQNCDWGEFLRTKEVNGRDLIHVRLVIFGHGLVDEKRNSSPEKEGTTMSNKRFS